MIRKRQSQAAVPAEVRVREKAQPFYLHAAGHETVAVLIHGFTGSPYDMRELGDFLFSHGIDVYGVRVAGHGTSPSDLMQTTHEDWLESIRQVVALVEPGHKRIFLVGYSFGGNLALEVAAREPKRYAGVVALGTSVFLTMSKPVQYYLHYMNYLLRFVGKHTWRKPYVPRDRVETWESTGNYARIPLKSMLDWKHFIDHRTQKAVKHIVSPVLLMHSRNDRISHPRSSEYLFDKIGSAYKELFILPEFNHNPLRSESRDKIFSKVLEFVQR